MVQAAFSLLPADYEEDEESPFGLSPEDGDKDEEEIVDEEGDKGAAKPSDEPSELEKLEARVKQLSDSNLQIEELKKAVGRIQSAMSKLDKAADVDTMAKLQTSMREEFGSVHELLAGIVTNAEETVFPADFRKKVTDIQDEIRQRTEKDSLRNDVSNSVSEAVKAYFEGLGLKAPATQDASPDVSAAKSLEDEMVSEIRDYGLDDNDFDWASAAQIYKTQGAAATKSWFRKQILEKRESDSADTRRQARKESVGTGAKAPAAAGPGTSNEERLVNGKLPFADAYELGRKMGWVS